jgi:co-chaperonin GroES (HSP10)
MAHLAPIDLDPTSLRPLRGRVWVRIDDRDETTASGLIVKAHIARPLPNLGVIIRCGAEVTCVEPGQHVRFDKGAHALRECVFINEPGGKVGRYLDMDAKHVDMVVDGATRVEGTEQ